MATYVVSSPEFSPERRLSRSLYRIADKVRILQELRDTPFSVEHFAEEMGITSSMLHRWKKQKALLVQSMEDRGRNLRRISDGPMPLYGREVEESLKEFMKVRRDNHLHVSSHLLLTHWRRLDPEGTSELTLPPCDHVCTDSCAETICLFNVSHTKHSRIVQTRTSSVTLWRTYMRRRECFI